MIVVFTAYWAFFAWVFYDNFIINFIYSLMDDVYFDVCDYYDPVADCQLAYLIPDFPAPLAFIVAFMCTVNSRGLFED
jgi:hypothetical protein